MWPGCSRPSVSGPARPTGRQSRPRTRRPRRNHPPIDLSTARLAQEDHRGKDSDMSIGKKIANKAEAARGTAKTAVGRATGNNRLKTEGREDRVAGNTKQAATKMKDAFKH